LSKFTITGLWARLTRSWFHKRYFTKLPGTAAQAYVRFFDKAVKLPQERSAMRLDLPTYDGLSQAVHPDLLLHKGKVIMVATPYPFGCDWYENPCIFVSSNSKSFAPPAGVSQPLALPTEGFKNHLSDAEIHFWQGEYHIIYRESLFKNSIGSDRLYLINSPDLIKWSKPTLLAEAEEGLLTCPSVVEHNGKRTMFHVAYPKNGEILLQRRDLLSASLGSAQQVELKGMPEGRVLWHIDIVPEGEKLLGLFTLSTGGGGQNTKLYYAQSTDGGASFEILHPIRLCSNEDKYFLSVYRASMYKGARGSWQAYVSARTAKHTWHIYYLPDFRVDWTF
jgi:hypothetical protein